jgi:hypothetical protein
MRESAIVRWSDPELILVVTNLLEGYTLMLHAIYQARLSNARVLLVHVVPPSFVREETRYGAPLSLSGSSVRAVKEKLGETALQFQK